MSVVVVYLDVDRVPVLWPCVPRNGGEIVSKYDASIP